MKLRIGYLGIVVAVMSAALAGCGGGGGGGGSDSTAARATIVLANDSALSDAPVARGGSGGGPVPVEDILSLTVSITEISLQTCSSTDTEHGAGEQEDVHVSDFAFDPSCVTIEEGGTVRWEWETDTAHTITSGSPGDPDVGVLFDEVREGTDSVVELVFEEAGIYPYFSDTETDVEEGMAGIVKVVEDDDGDDEDRSGDNDGEGESEEEEGETTVVYEGAFDVNLLDLTALSEVLTTADIPAGKYCKIILQIGDPRLVLVDDPETVITDIHLTANGRLFIKDRFTVGEQEDIIIVLNFGGIHLVEKGNGGYVLTPKVRAEVNVDEQETAVEGDITSINAEAQIIEIESEDGSTYEVLVTDDTVIKTDNDADDEEEETRHGDDGDHIYLKFEDLQVGQRVEVEGTLSEGGQILADVIVVGDESYVSPTEVEFEGEITSIDPETQIIEVQTAEDLIEVHVTGETEIKSDDDGDDEVRTDDGGYIHLKFEDLQVGQTVEVEGLQIEGEPVRAHEIEIADDDFVSPVVVEFFGEILSVDAETSSVQVQTDLETYTLLVNDNTTIKTDNDADDEVRTGSSEYVLLKFEDLVAGQNIEVRGYLIGEGEVRADRIEIDDEDYETPAE